MTDNNNWRSLFVGRETELAWLQDAWKKAQDGQPQLRVLRGESGLGKTKIVQELYAWLSRTDVADPDDYWPPHLIAGDNLRLNPDLATQPLGEKMRYLWWGLRWLPPSARNQGELTHCAFFDQRQMLQPHWQNLARFKDTAVATLKLGGEIGSVALDLAKDAAASLFPLLGIIKAVADVGEAVRDLGEAASDLGDEFDRHSKSPAQREAEELAEQIDQIVAFLAWVLKPFYRSGSGSMPIVLVLDDAQWIDQRSMEVVSRLFAQAQEHKWPLLIVATHWEREWHEALAVDDTAAGDNPATDATASFAASCEALAEQHGDACDILDLTRLGEASAILRTAFPGLRPEQIQTLADRADGNARLLVEIILYLESEPSLFEDDKLDGPLDDVAIDELDIEMAGFDLNRLQEKRYQRLPVEIRTVLSLASLQGVRFLADLVNELSRDVGVAAPSGCAASLGKAEHPHAIISSSGLGREFRFEIFHQSARRFFERLCRRKKLDDGEILDALLRIAMARLGSRYYARLTDLERESLLVMLLQSVRDTTQDFARILLWTADHDQETSNFIRRTELMGQWQRLIGARIIPFNPQFTEVRAAHTPFYSGWIVFALADYDVMPATRIVYATDGEKILQLDGSAESIHTLNGLANVCIDELTALDYVRFYLANVCFEDGVSQIIESKVAMTIAPAGHAVHDVVAAHFRHPQVIWNDKDGEGRVSLLFAQRGSLFDIELKIDAGGGIDVAAESRLTDGVPRAINLHGNRYAQPDSDGMAGEHNASLDGAVRPALSGEVLSDMLRETRRLFALTGQATELLAMWDAGEVEIRVFDSDHELTLQPRGSHTLYIGLPRYRALNQERLTLLVAYGLLEEVQTRLGKPLPKLTDPKDTFVQQWAERKASQVAHLCSVAFDLSLKDGAKDYDFIAQMHALGHGKAMDIFVNAP